MEDATIESNVALGKKVNIDPIDEKTLKAIISTIGKEKKKPGSGLVGGAGKGTPKKPGPVYELCSLPAEEKEIVCDSFDEQLKRNILPDSIVSVGENAFVADRLTGVPCPHYWFAIPSASTLVDIGAAINRGNKGKQQRLHNISGKVDSFHGAFATVDNLFTYLHCILSISVSSPIFRDLLKVFHIEGEQQSKSFTSKKLRENYAAVLKSKVFGGSSHLIVPAQAARQGKSLKSPGCFFYCSDNENPFGYATVKHTILSKRHNLPAELNFPTYADWESTLAASKNNRSRSLENHNKWKEFAETYGEEATVDLFKKLAERKKAEKARKRDDNTIGLDEGDGIVAYGDGSSFRATKKPRLQDMDTDDEDDSVSSSSPQIFIEEEGVVSVFQAQKKAQEEEQESDRLIQEFLDSMKVELNNDLKRNSRHSDWGDDGAFLEIADEIDWRGVDTVDDSSRNYKKDVRKIHSLLKKKRYR
jgi:hypothetical protein